MTFGNGPSSDPHKSVATLAPGVVGQCLEILGARLTTGTQWAEARGVAEWCTAPRTAPRQGAAGPTTPGAVSLASPRVLSRLLPHLQLVLPFPSWRPCLLCALHGAAGITLQQIPKSPSSLGPLNLPRQRIFLFTYNASALAGAATEALPTSWAWQCGPYASGPLLSLTLFPTNTALQRSRSLYSL